eukprot:695718-Pleurochrysis_carterae.AAC.1
MSPTATLALDDYEGNWRSQAPQRHAQLNGVRVVAATSLIACGRCSKMHSLLRTATEVQAVSVQWAACCPRRRWRKLEPGRGPSSCQRARRHAAPQLASRRSA